MNKASLDPRSTASGSIRTLMFLVTGFLLVLLIVSNLLGFFLVNKVEDEFASVLEDRVAPLQQLKVVSDMYAVEIVDTLHKVNHGGMGWAIALNGVHNARQRLQGEWLAYMKTRMDEEELNLASRARRLMQQADPLLLRIEQILEREDRQALDRLVREDLYPVIDPISQAVSRLTQLQLDRARKSFEETIDSRKRAWATTFLLILLALLLSTFGSFRVVGIIGRQLAQASDLLQRIVRGDLQGTLSLPPKRELGELVASIEAVQMTYRRLERQRRFKSLVARLSQELQACETLNDFGACLIQRIAPMLEAEIGAFYLRDDDGVFQCRAGHNIGLDRCRSFRSGEGLAGEAVAQGKVVTCDALPDTYLRLETATLSVAPRQLTIIPLEVAGERAGVIELAHVGTPERSDEVINDILPVVAFNLEILQRKLAVLRDYALRKREEERQRLILSSVTDGIFGLDLGGRITFANPATEQMLGFAPGEILGQEMHALTHHHYADGREFPRHECSMYKTTRDGQSRTVTDEVFWRKDGSSFPIDYITTPVIQDDEILGAVISFRDSSERLRLERQQQDQLELLHALIDTIPYPVFYKGRDTRFLGVNRAYEKVFGITRDQLIGRRVLEADYLTEDERHSFQQEDERVIAETTLVEKELSLTFADGKQHDTLYCVAGFRTSNDAAGGLVGTLIDVSDRKRVEGLERFNRLAEGREKRIVELKQEVNRLAVELCRERPYAVPEQLETALPEAPEVIHSELTAVEIGRKFDDFLHMEQMQQLFQDFSLALGVPMAIIDLEANVLASSRWQRCCTDFHRVDERSCANCVESDTGLAVRLEAGQDFTMYRCKNGMTDCAAPIVVNGVHVANAFIGQFHLQAPDEAFFLKQAEAFGYDPEDYLAAIHEAPVMDEQKLPHILGFLARFARLIGAFAVEQLKASRAEAIEQRRLQELSEGRQAALSLAEDADRARTELQSAQRQLEQRVADRTHALEQEREQLHAILDTSPVGVGITVDGVFRFANPRITELLGVRVDAPSIDLYVDPEDRTRLLSALAQGERVQNFQTRLYDPEGHPREMLVTFYPVEFEGQAGILGWIVDINDIHRSDANRSDEPGTKH